jgi:hypothetical protein
MSMSTAKARALAMTFPEAVEEPHFHKASFRVAKKIFATMDEADGHMVVKLTPDQQAMMTEVRPDLYQTVPGAWGRQGSTFVRLAAADAATLRRALAMSYRNVAPKKLAALAAEE